MGYIYGLSSDADDVIKYIGLTESSLSHRLSQHLVDKRVNKRTSWIKSIRNANQKLQITEIDYCNVLELPIKEIEYIKLFKSIGAPLKNMTSGGHRTTHNQDTKDKISAAKIGKKLSESHYKNVCEANKKCGKNRLGVPLSESNRINIGNALRGKKKSKSSVDKMVNWAIPKRKIIVQYDLNDNKITEWESISHCCKISGYCKGNIIKVCKNKIRKDGSKCKTAYGFKWSYK